MNNIQITFLAIIIIWVMVLIIIMKKGKFKTENSAEHEENQRTNYSGLG